MLYRYLFFVAVSTIVGIRLAYLLSDDFVRMDLEADS